MTNISPYALLLGFAAGIFTLFALRHPPFGLFIGIAATVLIDWGLKQKNGSDE